MDRILSFTVGADTVQLENRAFRGLPEGPLAGDAFASFGNAGEADDRIIYNQATGELYFDADGGGRQHHGGEQRPRHGPCSHRSTSSVRTPGGGRPVG